MAFAFEKLIVYQKAVDFADQVLAATEPFPRGYAFLSDQLNRASVSIAANLAEGNGRFTKPDRKHFFGIARAKAAGVRFGRPATVDAPLVRRLHHEGLGTTAIARRLGISRQSVYKALRLN